MEPRGVQLALSISRCLEPHLSMTFIGPGETDLGRVAVRVEVVQRLPPPPHLAVKGALAAHLQVHELRYVM